MIVRHQRLLPCLAALAPGVAAFATPLRTVDSVPFSQEQFLAWAEPALCDPDRNVFLLVLQQVARPDVKKAPAAQADLFRLRHILRVSADGKKRTYYDPGATSAFSGADEVTTVGTALDPGGTLFALVSVTRGDTGRYYIVSFDESGRHRSRLELDPEEMAFQRFEVFGSGEFLVRGRRTRPDGVRVAILPAGGGPLRDVIGLPFEEVDEVGDAPKLAGLGHMVRGGDGRIYVVPDAVPGGEEDSVYVIEASGDSHYAFSLAPMPRNRRLIQLKASGQRLAAVYYEEGAGDKSGGLYWMAAYDVVLGERLAVYGPAPGAPLCYQSGAEQDRFTLLSDGNLVTVSP